MNDELHEAQLARRSRKAYAETKPLRPAPQEQLPLTGDALMNELLFQMRARLNELSRENAHLRLSVQRLEGERLALLVKVAEYARVREGSD